MFWSDRIGSLRTGSQAALNVQLVQTDLDLGARINQTRAGILRAVSSFTDGIATYVRQPPKTRNPYM